MTILNFVNEFNVLELGNIVLFTFVHFQFHLLNFLLDCRSVSYCILKFTICFLVIDDKLLVVALQLLTILDVVNCSLERFLSALEVVVLNLILKSQRWNSQNGVRINQVCLNIFFKTRLAWWDILVLCPDQTIIYLLIIRIFQNIQGLTFILFLKKLFVTFHIIA